MESHRDYREVYTTYSFWGYNKKSATKEQTIINLKASSKKAVRDYCKNENIEICSSISILKGGC